MDTSCKTPTIVPRVDRDLRLPSPLASGLLLTGGLADKGSQDALGLGRENLPELE